MANTSSSCGGAGTLGAICGGCSVSSTLTIKVRAVGLQPST